MGCARCASAPGTATARRAITRAATCASASPSSAPRDWSSTACCWRGGPTSSSPPSVDSSPAGRRGRTGRWWKRSCGAGRATISVPGWSSCPQSKAGCQGQASARQATCRRSALPQHRLQLDLAVRGGAGAGVHATALGRIPRLVVGVERTHSLERRTAARSLPRDLDEAPAGIDAVTDLGGAGRRADAIVGPGLEACLDVGMAAGGQQHDVRRAVQVIVTHQAAQFGAVEPGHVPVDHGEGMETLELLLQEHAPRLAVVDWDMPGLDGPELCRLVRDYHLDGPPYIVLLAAGRHPDIEAGFEAGANDCIRTPARAAEIRDRVDAGWRFVQVPWERARRGATLEAVRSLDTDDEAWDPAESRGVHAGAGAPTHRKVELQAVLRGR